MASTSRRSTRHPQHDDRAPVTLGFARAARVLAAEARSLGLTAPGFRSPPGLSGSDRTIRRAPWGAVVSIRLRDRMLSEVLADMVDGVVVANRLPPDDAARIRETLLEALLLDSVSDGSDRARAA